MRRFRKRKYIPRRRRYRQRRQFNKVKRDVKWLKKGIEHKLFEDYFLNVQVTTTPALRYLTTVTRGEDDYQRTGSDIRANRIKIRGYINNKNGLTPGDAIVRMMLVRWKNSRGGTLAFSNILADTPTDGSGLNINRFMNKDLSQQYKVYYDHTFVMDTALSSYAPFKISQKLGNIIKYNINTGVEAACMQNGLYLVFWSTQAPGDEAPTISFTSRLSYTDS